MLHDSRFIIHTSGMWLRITLVVSKLILWGMRRVGRGGTALPGLIAERMYPGMLEKMLAQMPEGTVLVTGTNGKTTTSKILRGLLEARGQHVLANRSGSNFTRGILGSVIEHSTWTGGLDYDIALFEVDEAYARLVAKEVKPRAMLVLNVMRDQLDRYGEIDKTAGLIAEALEYSGGAILNADDPPVVALAAKQTDAKKTTYYGVSQRLRHLLPTDEELHGHQKPTAAVKADVMLESWEPGDPPRLSVETAEGVQATSLKFEGIHNAQNAAGALAAVYHLFGAVTPNDMLTLSTIKPAFGRGERLTIRGVKTHLALIKNPSGFNQNLRAFIKPKIGTVLIMINDRYADSRDVSWLWDVDLSPLKAINARFITGGIRAYDMALRLQYEDIEVRLSVQPIRAALQGAVDMTPPGTELLILPTYTAMLEVRKILSKTTEMEKIWK